MESDLSADLLIDCYDMLWCISATQHAYFAVKPLTLISDCSNLDMWESEHE